MQTTSLHSLLDFLRARGFSLGTDDYIAVADLQVALHREKLDREQWRTLIGPLVCKNARQQQEFQQLFEQWSRQQDAPADSASPGGTPRYIPETLTRSWLWWLVGGLLFCLFAWIAWLNTDRTGNAGRLISGSVFNQQKVPLSGVRLASGDKSVRSDSAGLFSLVYLGSEDRLLLKVQANGYHPLDTMIALTPGGRDKLSIVLAALSDSVASERPTTSPTQAEEIGNIIRLAKLTRLVEDYNKLAARTMTASDVDPWLQRLHTYEDWIKAAAVITPLMIFLIWWLPRFVRRRLFLQRLSGKTAVFARDLLVGDVPGENELFSGYQKIFRDLRRFRHQESTMLDITASVDATASAAGRFTPVFGTRRRQPEYLILVDTHSFQDHQARIVFELVERMHSSAIAVVCYSFNGDPRKLYDPFEPGKGRSLFEITSIYQHYHLLIFGDGSGCFDILSGRLERWAEIFRTWPDIALFTPENTWNYKAVQFRELGFQVFPWLKEGMEQLIGVLNEELTDARRPADGVENFPPLLMARTHRWLEHKLPSPALSEKLISQLQVYLDPGALDWLRAVAVYPAINWSMTMVLGHNLQTPNGQRLFSEERLIKLSRLPWLRQGIMPDWFRLLLLKGIPPSLEKQVRWLIGQLLASAAKAPEAGFRLTVATNRQDLTDVSEWMSALPDDHRIKDAVFLDFMGAKTVRKLSVDLPGALRKFLFRDGHRFLGFDTRNMAITAATVSLLVAIFMGFWEPPPAEIDTLPAFSIIAGENFVNAEWGEPYAVADSGWAGRLLGAVSEPALAEILQTMRNLGAADSSDVRARLSGIKPVVDSLLVNYVRRLRNEYDLYASLTAPQDFEISYNPFPDFSDANPSTGEFMYDGQALIDWEAAPLFLIPQYYVVHAAESNPQVLTKQLPEIENTAFDNGIYKMFEGPYLLATGPMGYRSATIMSFSAVLNNNVSGVPFTINDGQLLVEKTYPPQEDELFAIRQVTASRDSAINHYIAAAALDIPASIFWKADGRFAIGYGPEPYLEASDLQRQLSRQEGSQSTSLNTGSDIIARQRGVVQRRLCAVYGRFSGLGRGGVADGYQVVAESRDGTVREIAPVYQEGRFILRALPSDVYRLFLQTPRELRYGLTEFTLNFIDETNHDIGAVPWPEVDRGGNPLNSPLASNLDVSSRQEQQSRADFVLRSNPVDDLDEALLRKRLAQTGLFTSDWTPGNTGYLHQLQRSGDNVGDLASGNLWQSSPEIRPLTFASASAYATQLTPPPESESRTRWRLPTVEEALSIVNSRRTGKGGYLPAIFNSEPNTIWTSDGSGEGRRWIVDYQTATCRIVSEDDYHHVRLIIPADPSYLYRGPAAN